MTAGKFSFLLLEVSWMATFTSVPKAHCFSRFTSCYHLRCLSSWNPLRETETGTWTRSWTAGPSQRSWTAPWTSCLAQVWSLTQFFSRLAHMTVSLFLFSFGSNARGESRAREGRRVSSKSPSRVRDRDEGIAGRNGRE